jgi:hypothetical protein
MVASLQFLPTDIFHTHTYTHKHTHIYIYIYIYIIPPHTVTTYLISIFIVSPHVHIGFRSGRLPSGLQTNTSYIFLISLMLTTWPVHFNLLKFMILLIFMQFSPSFYFRPNILIAGFLCRVIYILPLTRVTDYTFFNYRAISSCLGTV